MKIMESAARGVIPFGGGGDGWEEADPSDVPWILKGGGAKWVFRFFFFFFRIEMNDIRGYGEGATHSFSFFF